MNRFYIAKALRTKVAAQARYRCGYCLTSQEYSGAFLEIEHLVPLKLGGTSAEENLWLACSWCNRYKSFQVDGVDPISRRRTALYNPRRQVWARHFRWSEDGVQIIGKTACGRTTVVALHLNHKFIVAARRRWVSAGWHPPKD
ncbi:HNH endonuclease [candidate division KSB1 bacterium]|nr:HNH endonuclease [candidate division KSB1 bacterium]